MSNNANEPAMPCGVRQDPYNPGQFPECVGMTKREMFAMHAPDCPEWYDSNQTCQGTRFWNWRLHYADVMLSMLEVRQ